MMPALIDANKNHPFKAINFCYLEINEYYHEHIVSKFEA